MSTSRNMSRDAARVDSPRCTTAWSLGPVAFAAIVFLKIGGPLAAAPPTLAPTISGQGERTRQRPAEQILDVALQMPNGVLFGRVAPPTGKRPEESVAGLQVLLLKNGRPAAETRTDREGRFRLGNLSGGVYLVVVNGAGGPAARQFRAWAPMTAPPNAATTADVRLKETLVLGQGPFPLLSFPRAAVGAGIAAGAIAAPIIYQSARRNNRGPVSP